MRLDVYLFDKKLTETRSRAKNLIELGNVLVNEKVCTKPSLNLKETDKVEIIDRYLSSLGSIKLEEAFSKFSPDVEKKICLDLGAANGGFTETLLKHGAKGVFALDIGPCALNENLLNDNRVFVMEKTNARYIKKSDFNLEIDFITGDLSFISLKNILKPAYDVLSVNGKAIFLIKPQFELGKKDLPKSGIIKDQKKRQQIIDDISNFSKSIGFTVKGITPAPHPFENKNQEYLIYLVK